NGIDGNIWNPEKDKLIAKKYSIKNIDNKLLNKKSLIDKFGLEFDETKPVIGMISRLNDLKGFDLVQKAFKDLMKLDAQFILLGTGDKKYHTFFEKAFAKHSDKFAFYLGFDDQLAHLIEAGSDMYLMPSKIEPCGLNQMYSLVYGTVPIVRETGGLADTVDNYDETTGSGNGFVFKKYDAASLLVEVKRAINLFSTDKKTWLKIQKVGMKNRDGTINIDTGYIGNPNLIELYSGVIEGIKILKEKFGFLIVVISNQSGITRGLITQEDVDKVNKKINDILVHGKTRIDAFYYCPYHPEFDSEEKCKCRKPSPQLVYTAAEELKIDLKKSFFIGDRISDIECGKNA
ncbi:unnamed protein product, partial [Cyprideis torosa]